MNGLQLTSLDSCLQCLPALAGRAPLPRTLAALPVEKGLTEAMQAALHIPGHGDGDQDKPVRPLAGVLRG
jgi:hypothetical protein